ncbi:MAG: enoyl-CoA hydratase/isomerase family protein [Promethearchaeota archaeon]
MSSNENVDTPTKRIIYEVKGKVAYITINRPEKKNAVDFEMVHDIVNSLEDAEKNPKVKVIVFRSVGDDIFSAGFDLGIFKSGLKKEVLDELLSAGGKISRMIFRSKKPVITQIQGPAVGLGCIISLSSDFRIAADKKDIFFQLPELEINIFPATGPTAQAVKTLGVTHAKDMLLTARRVPLDEFNSWGAITKVVPPDELKDAVKKFARSLASKSPLLEATTKAAIHIMSGISEKSHDLEDECAYYFFKNIGNNNPEDLDDFISKIWAKYGKN